MHGCLFSLTLNAGVFISQVWLITLKPMHGCLFSFTLNAGVVISQVCLFTLKFNA